MKLNKDNYELVMFDLLEGNLSEADELRVMDQIEGDEFLFREWKLFKSTVLIADKEVTYSGKSKLLKEEKAVIMPMYTRWAAVAASVCILAAAVLFWPDTEKVSPLVDATESAVVEPAAELPVGTEEVLVSDKLDAPDETEKSNTPTKNIERNTSVYNTPRDIVADVPPTEIEQQEKPIEFKAPRIEDVPVNNAVVARDTKQDEELILPELVPESVEIVADISKPTSPIALTAKEKAIGFVTKNPPRRIKEKAIEILALMSNPKIKFNPSFKNKRPSLEIELETNGYAAVASLQPFRNRN
tara:strand:+ start:1074 stop:1973 length:900 start_codon:yes stop_codon:yes gene_type:complete